MNEALLETARRELHQAHKILVTTHVRPDGDAIGSLLGLGLALQAIGKQVQLISRDGIPASMRYLPGSSQVVTQSNGVFDLEVVVDCSDVDRIGNGLVDHRIPDINIDHHITNNRFARINLVQHDATATSEIIAQNLAKLDLPLTVLVASALLMGILTDTIGFRTDNLTPQTMRITAKLMEAGANIHELYHRLLVQRTFPEAHYWGSGLSKLQRDRNLIWTTLTLEDRNKADYPGSDDADLINILSTIEGADIALVFIEQTHRHVKVSWRSQSGIDVSQVAVRFGGGGHKAAAGADVEGTLEDVQKDVLEATQVLCVQEKVEIPSTF